MRCLAGCTILLHSKEKTQEETENFRGSHSCGQNRAEVRRCQFCFQPHRPGMCLCVVWWELVIIKASCLPGGNTISSSHCLCPSWSSASSQYGAERANITDTGEVPPGSCLKVSTVVPMLPAQRELETESQSWHPVDWSKPTLLKADCP